MRIAWLSRHQPTPLQRAELRRLFGDYELNFDASPFEGIADIARRIRESEAQEVVIVAPLSVQRKLLEFGFRPIVADMQQCPACEAEVKIERNGEPRYYKFLKFRRLTGIEMTYEEISPCPARTTGLGGK